MSNFLFVTGAGRSGTTLLDKLISMHPGVLVLSQPLPLAYVAIKKEYMNDSHCPTITPDYPLNDLFAGNYCDPENFTEYLCEKHFPVDFFKKVLSSMVDYDGQYTKPASEFKFIGKQNLSLAQFVTRYTEWLAFNSGRDSTITGTKETFTEEYIPYFIANGSKVIQIMRDPRDVLASLSFGDGGKYSGKAKPHLFNIRQWRKSIAYAAKMKGNHQYLQIRYEDLVMNPLITMNQIARFLNIEAYSDEAFSKTIYSQSGEIWASNSSFEPSSYLNNKSVGNYINQLPKTVRLFVEACCYYEMKLFDYRSGIKECEIRDILTDYNEILPIGRDDLKAYFWTDARRVEELARVESLKNNRYIEQEFIFRDTFNLLIKNSGFKG